MSTASTGSEGSNYSESDESPPERGREREKNSMQKAVLSKQRNSNAVLRGGGGGGGGAGVSSKLKAGTSASTSAGRLRFWKEKLASLKNQDIMGNGSVS